MNIWQLIAQFLDPYGPNKVLGQANQTVANDVATKATSAASSAANSALSAFETQIVGALSGAFIHIAVFGLAVMFLIVGFFILFGGNNGAGE
jgi:predicted lipid-binding transport protein (Tim44 family)